MGSSSSCIYASSIVLPRYYLMRSPSVITRIFVRSGSDTSSKRIVYPTSSPNRTPRSSAILSKNNIHKIKTSRRRVCPVGQSGCRSRQQHHSDFSLFFECSCPQTFFQHGESDLLWYLYTRLNPPKMILYLEATVVTATLLGCVTPIRCPLAAHPASNKYCGTCVDFPEPVSPTRITV